MSRPRSHALPVRVPVKVAAKRAVKRDEALAEEPTLKANAGKANAGNANAGKANAGKANAGKANAGMANAGMANAGKANAGPAARLDLSLSTLIQPQSAQRFLADHWQAAPSLFPAQIDVARLAAAIPELFDLRRLARRYHDPVPVLQDQPIELPALEAVERYERAGATLRFIDLHRFLPRARRWRDRMSRDLGLPLERSKCSLYASPRGYGLPWHFDSNDNFVIQLAGRKRWTLAPNADVSLPIHDSMWLGQPEPDGFRTYSANGLPARITGDVRSFELEPGTVLYLPRGYWHSTECTDGTSLSMNFTLSASPFYELVLPCIERALLAHDKWRVQARGAWGSETDRRGARAQLRALLAGLSEDLSVIEAEDVIRPAAHNARGPLRADEALHRSPLIVPAIQGPMPDGQGAKLVTFKGPPYADKSGLALKRSYLPVLTWILRRRELTLSETARAFPKLPEPELRELLVSLISVGFLNRPNRK